MTSPIWKEKVVKGMQLIKEGCDQNDDYHLCTYCPFNEFCTILWKTYNKEFTAPELFEKLFKKGIDNVRWNQYNSITEKKKR